VIQGIDFVTQNAGQIEVANLSFCGIGYSSALRLAIRNSVAQGVVYVVSGGNDLGTFTDQTASRTLRMIRFPPLIPKS